eukprot:scaffold19.g1853.t1
MPPRKQPEEGAAGRLVTTGRSRPPGGRPPRPPTGQRRKAAEAPSAATPVLSPRNKVPPGASAGAKAGTAVDAARCSAKEGCDTGGMGAGTAPAVPAASGAGAVSPQVTPRLEDSVGGMAAAGDSKPVAPGSPLAALKPVPGPAAHAAVARAEAANSPPPGEARASGGGKGLRSVLLMLDRLEAEAAEEVAQLTPSRPAGSALAQAVASQPLSLSSRRALALAPSQPGVAAALEAAAGGSMAQKCERVLSQVLGTQREGGHPGAGAGAPASAQGVPPGEAAAVRDAAAVAAGVRGKIQRLQQAVADKDCEIAALRARAEALAAARDEAAAAAAEQRGAALAAARREHDAELGRAAALARGLAGEKEALAAKCAALEADLAAMQAECTRQIEGLRDGVARELRRQKEMWMAAEQAKREAWMAQKERSIREATIKGLEPEVQKLVAVHKAELKRAEQAWEAETGRRLAVAAAQHEEAAGAARAAAAAAASAASAAERGAAARAAEEAAQRFEGELCALRLRLAAEHQVALERSEAGRREDRSAHEERVRQLAREHEQRLAALRAEWEEDRAAAAARAQRELAAAREEATVGQEAWRAAVSERAARELEAREGALRRKLTAERDEELRAVVARLEEVALAREQALEERGAAAEAAAEAAAADALACARREGGAAAERAAAAEARCGRLESLLETLQQEVASKGAALARLEAAAAAAQGEAAREREAAAEREAARAAEATALASRVAAADEAAAAAERAAAAAATAREEEMGALEARRGVVGACCRFCSVLLLDTGVISQCRIAEARIMRDMAAEPAAEAPPPRGGAAVAAIDGRRVLVYGGADRSPQAFGDWWVLEVAPGSRGGHWTKVSPVVKLDSKRQPLPRCGASLTYLPGPGGAPGKAYLFGGHDPVAGAIYDDLLASAWGCLDTDSWELSAVALPRGAPRPPGRHSHVAGPYQQRALVLFGGAGLRGPLADVWLFDAADGEWRCLSGVLEEEECPAPREMAAGTMISDAGLLVHGGRGADGALLDDLCIFDGRAGRWVLVQSTGAPRCAHTACNTAAVAAAPPPAAPQQQGQQQEPQQEVEHGEPQPAGSGDAVAAAAGNSGGGSGGTSGGGGGSTSAQASNVLLYGGFTGMHVAGDILQLSFVRQQRSSGGHSLRAELRPVEAAAGGGPPPPPRFAHGAAVLAGGGGGGGAEMVVVGGVNQTDDLADVHVWEAR